MSAQPERVWFETVREFTHALVQVRGVSPSREENAVASAILDLLHRDGLADAYTASGYDLVRDDPWERRNVHAFVRGASPRTVILLGHYDTVDVGDYGPLASLALDPDALAARADELAAFTPGVREDLETAREDWMFGRGAADMKSGVAINLALIRHYAGEARAGRVPPLSLLFLATPDEEVGSAGVHQATRFLLALREREGLTYLGVVNTDTTLPLSPGDPQHYAYLGTCGKLLPCLYIVGREAHVGEPFAGLDANLLAAEIIRDLSMNPHFCDSTAEQRTPPPVTLRASDLKDHYDVQLPFAAYCYLNVLTFTTDPGALLARLRSTINDATERVLERVAAVERTWTPVASLPPVVHERSAYVLMYAELHAQVEERLGRDAVARAMDEVEAGLPATLDPRERVVRLTEGLWRASGLSGPAVVIAYAPPYYPHIAPAPGPLHDAIRAVVADHPEAKLRLLDYYPYISDMSYLSLDPGTDVAALAANMPVWQPAGEARTAHGYSVPLDEMAQLHLPVVNIGPHGKGIHQRGERVAMHFSFETVPTLIAEAIARMGQTAE